MGKRGLGATRARRLRGRPRLRLRLTDAALAELDRVVLETGAWTRSLVVGEAIHAGLRNPEFPFAQKKPRRIVEVRVPKQLIDDVRRLAKAHSLTQQSLLRQLLSHYLAHLPHGSTEDDADEQNGPEEVLV